VLKATAGIRTVRSAGTWYLKCLDDVQAAEDRSINKA